MITRVLLTLLVGCWIAHPAIAEVIRLKNGHELHCEILEYDEENGITVKRLDNGGIFALRWEHILEKDVKSIRTARGYTDEKAVMVLIPAKRILLRNNTYEVGLQVESDRPGMLCLERQGKKYYFRPTDVKEIAPFEVEAREVYTLDALYQRKLEEKIPSTVEDFFGLGVYLESVGHYVKAFEQYQKVRELDAEYKPDVIGQKLILMDAKIKEADASNYLDEVKQLIYRKRYNLAIERLDAFPETFPDSVLVGDKEKLLSQAVFKRHAYYGQKILTDYFSYMGKVADKVASNRELPLDDAIDFAVEEMGPTIRQTLAEKVYNIPIEEVEQLWNDRKGGARRRYSYGTGTFILGMEKAKTKFDSATARAEEEAKKKEKEEEKPVSFDEKLKKRIEEIKRQSSRRSTRSSRPFRMDEVGRTPEQWWNTESVTNRRRFLIAYYAEFSKDMRIQNVIFTPCPHCSGKGWLEKISTADDENQKFPCEVCKTLGVERTIVFK